MDSWLVHVVVPKPPRHFWATWTLSFVHVVLPKPLRTFGRHARDYRAKPLPFGFRIANAAVEPYVWSSTLATMTRWRVLSSSSWIPSALAARPTPNATATPAPTRSRTSPRLARKGARIARGFVKDRCLSPTWHRSGSARQPRRRQDWVLPISGRICSPMPSTARRKKFRAARTRLPGHWEIAGLPVRFDWGYFPDTVPAFPADLTAAMIREGEVSGHSRQLPCAGHRDHRTIRRGTHPHRQADLLHLRRLGPADRRA